MAKDKSPKDHAEKAAWKFLSRLVGRNLLATILTLAILVGWGFEIGGKSLKGWYFITEFFSKRESVLTGSELEVANEWVIYIDSGAEFAQVEARRNQLVSSAPDPADPADEEDPWSHFVRNLRVVRDAGQQGNWILVADVNSGPSSKAVVEHTIQCVKSKVSNWKELDVFGSALDTAHALLYRVTTFAQVYGVPTNFDYVRYKETDLEEGIAGRVSCPYPYY